MFRRAAGTALVLVVAACSAPVTSPGPSVPHVTVGPVATPVATAIPSVPPPSVSPATGRIAFVRTAPPDDDDTRYADVFIVDADGSNLLQLTDDDKVESLLYWVADGSRLIVVWEKQFEPYQQFLTSMKPDGTDRVELGEVQTVYDDPTTSPDRRTIAFGGDGSEDQGTGVVLLDLVTGTRRQITTDGGTHPIWSADGKRIASFLPSRRVSVVDVATGNPVYAVDVDVQALVGFAADDSSILFAGCTGPVSTGCTEARMLIVSQAHPEPAEAQDLPGRIVGLASPDGAWVAALDAACQYTVIRPDAAEPIDLDTAGDIEVGCRGYRDASWSPDSHWLARTSGAGIVLVAAERGELVTVTSDPGDRSPAWQPVTP